MKILIDTNHPADTHFLKNLMRLLKNNGHEIIFVTSDKDINIDLCNTLNLDYEFIGSYGKNLMLKALMVPVMAWRLIKISLRVKPDILIGMGSRFVHAGFILSIPTITFAHTEHASEQNILFTPFATKIISPITFKYDYGKKHIKLNSFHELSYMTPKYFNPNKNILKDLNINKDDQYSIVRFVSWNASHDVGKKGLSKKEKITIVAELLKYGNVFISSEGDLPDEIKQYEFPLKANRLHDALAYSSLYIGEGATMASESACIGIPAIYTNPLIMCYVKDQIENDLVYWELEIDDILKRIISIFNTPKEEFKQNSSDYISSKIDLNEWLIDFIENKKYLK